MPALTADRLLCDCRDRMGVILNQVEKMLALGPFPRFTGSMVKNIESSWRKVVEGFGVEDTGGTVLLYRSIRR